MKTIVQRIKSPTPRFWKKVRNTMITIGTISGIVATAPLSLPAAIVGLAGYGVTIGIVGATLSQMTSKNHGNKN